MGAAQTEESGITTSAHNLVNAAAIMSVEVIEDVETAVAAAAKLAVNSIDLVNIIQPNSAEDIVEENKVPLSKDILNTDNQKDDTIKNMSINESVQLEHKYVTMPNNVQNEMLKQRRAKRFNTLKLVGIGIILTCITNFPSAFMHTSVNTAVEELNSYLRDSHIERGDTIRSDTYYALLRSFINSCWYAGQVVGALFSPILTDTYGRKPAYILATVIMTLACVLQMVSTLFPYPEFLIIGRILASMFSPMSDTVAILYLQEMSPPELRGALSSLFATGYCALGLLGMVLGIRPVLGFSLTLLFSVPIIPGILSLLFLVYLPETPKFLMITKKSRKDALISLNFFQGGISSDKEAILESYIQESKDEIAENGSVLSLLRVLHLRRALILSFLVMIPTLAFYPILQNSTYFFQRINLPLHLAQLSSSAMMVLLTICCIIAAFLLDMFSRRTLIVFFGLGSMLSLSIFAICATFAPVIEFLKYGAMAGLFGYIMCYGLAIGPISYFIAPELVPLQNRSSMFCVCFSLASVFIVFTNFATMPLFELIGAFTFVLLFVVPTALSILYLYLYLPETKNKETHEIVAVLRTGNCVHHNRLHLAKLQILENNLKN